MTRPKSYPMLLFQTCRVCEKTLAEQFFRKTGRGVTKTCISCLDGPDVTPPPTDEENVPQVPASHRVKRRAWPEGTIFVGAPPPPSGRYLTCQHCGAELPARTAGPGQPRKYCDSTCRAYAVKDRRTLAAIAGRRYRRKGQAWRRGDTR